MGTEWGCISLNSIIPEILAHTISGSVDNQNGTSTERPNSNGVPNYRRISITAKEEMIANRDRESLEGGKLLRSEEKEREDTITLPIEETMAKQPQQNGQIGLSAPSLPHFIPWFIKRECHNPAGLLRPQFYSLI